MIEINIRNAREVHNGLSVHTVSLLPLQSQTEYTLQSGILFTIVYAYRHMQLKLLKEQHCKLLKSATANF